MWDDIVKLLEEEISYYKIMLKAVDTQDAAMRRNDMDKIKECVKVQEQLMTRISLADNKIQEYIAEVKKQHNIHANLYLRKLASDFADEKNKPLIIERGNYLRYLAMQLKLKNRHCHKMINKQQTFIDYNVNVMTGTVAGETYAGSGTHEGAFRQRKMFDESV